LAYVRLSIVKPSRGQQAHVEKLMHDIADAVRGMPGCQQSMVLKADDSSGEIARIAVYDSDRSAANAANNPHVMALRSELHLSVEPGHLERSFDEI
jgi:quinol monooxygenase YgiN